MTLRVTIVQFDIVWEDKNKNLSKVETLISGLSVKTDLIILPEMFTTGFSMNSTNLAETNSGETISKIKEWSKKLGTAICGSFIAKDDNGKCYNRAFFISPQQATYYDKRHLFRMGEEPKFFEKGNRKLIVEHKGFKICLLICYDLRFPVWSRNINNEYDVLIYTANWPTSRIEVWKTLLKARAIENMAYVCGVNRIGPDGNKLEHNGSSMVIDAKGLVISDIQDNMEQMETIELSKEKLDNFRTKFPVWKDADLFELKD